MNTVISWAEPPSVFPWISSWIIGVHFLCVDKVVFNEILLIMPLPVKTHQWVLIKNMSSYAWDTLHDPACPASLGRRSLFVWLLNVLCFFLPWGLCSHHALMASWPFIDWSLDLSLKITFSKKLFLVYFLPAQSSILYALLYSLTAFSTRCSLYL